MNINNLENNIVGDLGLNDELENFTKEELVFLHLSNYLNQQDNYIVSELITQQGIQSVVDCDLGYISRILQKNEKMGYIFRTKSKVKNKKRKQNVFFLTTEGLKIAQEICGVVYESDSPHYKYLTNLLQKMYDMQNKNF